MLRRLLLALVALGLAGGGAAWILSAPRPLPAETLAALPAGDAERGQAVFWAGGCTSCHAAPKAEDAARFRLAGGVRLVTPFGTFVAPNISPDRTDGIGAWTEADFANAMLRGVSPEGTPFYPAFPYASYARMSLADVADLWAFLQTLPPVAGRAPDHELGFPFNIRRGVGLWQRLFLSEAPVMAVDTADPRLVRGRYLVEGPGHCGECHTPRTIAGASDLGRWLAGGPAPEGDGTIPDLTPGGPLGDWSEGDIAYYLESGFTPDFDSVGGSMAEVQRNMAELPAADRDAIAAYLRVVPSH